MKIESESEYKLIRLSLLLMLEKFQIEVPVLLNSLDNAHAEMIDSKRKDEKHETEKPASDTGPAADKP